MIKWHLAALGVLVLESINAAADISVDRGGASSLCRVLAGTRLHTRMVDE